MTLRFSQFLLEIRSRVVTFGVEGPHILQSSVMTLLVILIRSFVSACGGNVCFIMLFQIMFCRNVTDILSHGIHKVNFQVSFSGKEFVHAGVVGLVVMLLLFLSFFVN